MRSTKLLGIVLTGLVGSFAQAGQMFDLTVTNSSSMPISGGVVYVTDRQGGTSEVGQVASPGFVTLCQTGNSTPKFNELKSNSMIRFVAQTPGPILPGMSATFEVPMPAKTESLHFEAMYGKSKEACTSVSLPARAFHSAISSGEVIGRDEVVVAGASTQPEVPAMNSSAYQHICDGAQSAVDCLRLLSTPSSGGVIGYFPGYLPSILNYLEEKFGPADVQTLLIPTAGAVHYGLKMK